jgi:hypothetical protein
MLYELGSENRQRRITIYLGKSSSPEKEVDASSIGSYESLRRGKNTAGLAEEATKCSKEAERTAGSEKA